MNKKLITKGKRVEGFIEITKSGRVSTQWQNGKGAYMVNFQRRKRQVQLAAGTNRAVKCTITYEI